MGDFSFSSVSFSSEVDTVLNFFAYFFVSRQKSKWGLGQSPIIKYLKIKNINVLTIIVSCTKKKLINNKVIRFLPVVDYRY